MANEINNELLITFVELQPVLWDKSVEKFRNKQETSNAWKEVCIGLQPDFEKWKDGNKASEFCERVIKKWRNIRDCYMRYCRQKLKNTTHSGRGAGSAEMKKCIYSDLLHFFQKLTIERSTEDSLSSVIEETKTERDEPEIADASLDKKRSEQASNKRKHDEVETHDDKTLETENNEDSIMSFFASIVPHLQSFDENDMINFKMRVCQQVQNIKRNKKLRTQVICID